MPITPTYPGVYVEEIPSGVRTITGVPTSITAFVGRAKRGPIDDPIVINSFSDFERAFGGLWADSQIGYAVKDFFLNGGGQAIVVRLYHSVDGEKPKAALDANGFKLEAAYPGAWGNSLRARIDHNTRKLEPTEAADSLFNLAVYDGTTGKTEVFRNLCITKGHPRQADKVLTNESNLVRATALPAARPDKHADPASGKTFWDDDNASDKVADTDKATDGGTVVEADFTGDGKAGAKQGLYALEKADLFNILCLPPLTAETDVPATLIGASAAYCEARRAFLIIDPPAGWNSVKNVTDNLASIGTDSKNSAIFFPRLTQPNPLHDDQMENFAPCGAVAGQFARTDTNRGVWKAPAGLDTSLVGVPKLSVPLTDAENGQLNPLGVNCLRVMPTGSRVVWGSRTRQGDDRLTSDWKYIPVRRTALYIEESLYRGLKWVVFEPNDEPLWSQIRLNVGAFMHNLFRQGAFQGASPREAYFVKCDKETTTQNDINLGIVNIVVGFAPLKPAEFVVLKLQQIAGQVEA
jgi:uncharacterized protein